MTGLNSKSPILQITVECGDGYYRKCLTHSNEYLIQNPICPGLKDEVQDVLDTFDKMVYCYAKGIKDPKMAEIYAGIESFCRNLVHHLQMYEAIQNDSLFKAAYDSSKALDLRQIGERAEKGDVDKDFLDSVFSYVLTVRLWDDRKLSYFADLVSNPATDYRVAAMMISAAMLSSIKVFNYKMMTTFYDLWKKSQDVKIKERILVAWTVMLISADIKNYSYVKKFVNKIKEDEPTIAHLYAIQKQILFCMDAAEDAQQFSADIMNAFPDEKWNRPLENDEKPSLDEILTPEKKEEMVMSIDENINKMVNMQKQGADVFFDGFSQMKSFDFFNTASNWFVPYYESNPALYPLLEILEGDDTFLRTLKLSHSFCDGDKYSFSFCMAASLKGTLSALLPIVKEGFGPMFSETDVHDPKELAFLIRRECLQDLYRFLTLSSFKNSFPKVFSSEQDSIAYFFAKPLFKADEKFDRVRLYICDFLFKRNQSVRLSFFLSDTPRCKEEKLMKGLFLLSMTEYELAIDVLSPYQDEEENVEVIKPALVKCYIGLHQYDKALELCEQLISLKSTTKRLLQKVYCLFQLYRTDEAMAILYEMDYKNPNNLQILRPLAWGNILRFEYEKAKDIYERLASDDFSSIPEDSYNLAICLWLQGDVRTSISLFNRYLELADIDVAALIQQLYDDFRMLKNNGVLEFEVNILKDAISQYVERKQKR